MRQIVGKHDAATFRCRQCNRAAVIDYRHLGAHTDPSIGEFLEGAIINLQDFIDLDDGRGDLLAIGEIDRAGALVRLRNIEAKCR